MIYVTIYYVQPSSMTPNIFSSGTTRVVLEELPEWLEQHPGAMVTRIDR